MDIANLIRKAIVAYALEHQHPFYDIKSHQGWLRNVVVRSATTGELMINIVLGYEEAHQSTLFDQLLKQFPQITTLLYTINKKFNRNIIS